MGVAAWYEMAAWYAAAAISCSFVGEGVMARQKEQECMDSIFIRTLVTWVTEDGELLGSSSMSSNCCTIFSLHNKRNITTKIEEVLSKKILALRKGTHYRAEYQKRI